MIQFSFNGLGNRFLSVAEHCVEMSMLVPESDALQALMHDAAETYIGDYPSPVKDDRIRWMEDRIFAVIAARYHFDPVLTPSVRHYDRILCATEASVLFPGEDFSDWGPGYDVYPEFIPYYRFLAPAYATAEFLRRFGRVYVELGEER